MKTPGGAPQKPRAKKPAALVILALAFFALLAAAGLLCVLREAAPGNVRPAFSKPRPPVAHPHSNKSNHR